MEGVYTTEMLNAQGIGKRRRRSLITKGELYRVHRGCYLTGEVTPLRVAHALMLFSRVALTGRSAKELYMQQELSFPLELEGPRKINGRDFQVSRSRLPSTRLIQGLRVVAPLQAAKKSPEPENLLQHVFSGKNGTAAFHKQRGHLRRLPSQLKAAIKLATIGADSKPERMLGRALARDGFHVTHNYYAHGFRWDLQIGKVLIEIDGYEYHKKRPAFIADRLKQSIGILHGHIVLRFSADSVLFHLREVQAFVEFAVLLSQNKKAEPPSIVKTPPWFWHNLL